MHANISANVNTSGGYKQEIQDILIKNNQIKPAFNMIWLMKILKIQPDLKASDKVFRKKPFNIAKNTKHDGYQGRLALIVYECLCKKSAAMQADISGNVNSSGGAIKNEIT